MPEPEGVTQGASPDPAGSTQPNAPKSAGTEPETKPAQGTDNGKGPVPYDRFSEVNTAKNQLQAELEAARQRQAQYEEAIRKMYPVFQKTQEEQQRQQQLEIEQMDPVERLKLEQRHQLEELKKQFTGALSERDQLLQRWQDDLIADTVESTLRGMNEVAPLLANEAFANTLLDVMTPSLKQAQTPAEAKEIARKAAMAVKGLYDSARQSVYDAAQAAEGVGSGSGMPPAPPPEIPPLPTAKDSTFAERRNLSIEERKARIQAKRERYLHEKGGLGG